MSKNTKKQLKKINGMNAATKDAFEKGHRVPVYQDIATPPNPSYFVKVSKGVPYVNKENFGA